MVMWNYDFFILTYGMISKVQFYPIIGVYDNFVDYDEIELICIEASPLVYKGWGFVLV